MVIRNLSDKTFRQKLFYTIHIAGWGFFIKWITQIGSIYFFIVIPLLIFLQYKYSKKPIDDIADPWRDAVLIIIVVGYGVGSLWNFVGHFFMTEVVAESIG